METTIKALVHIFPGSFYLLADPGASPRDPVWVAWRVLLPGNGHTLPFQ